MQRVVLFLAVAGMCVPQMALAAETPANQPVVGDVRLLEGGVLIGQVVSPENTPLAGAQVVLHSGQQQLAAATADAGGYFAFRGLQSSRVYWLAAGNAQATYRAWAGQIAPPAAQPGVLLVSGPNTLRGQDCCGETCEPGCGSCGGGGCCACMRNFLANPIVVAGIVATAVAVPVAIHNANHGTASP